MITRYGNVRVLERVATFEVDDVVRLLLDDVKAPTVRVEHAGAAYAVDVVDRLRCFAQKGCSCAGAGCGRAGRHFALEFVSDRQGERWTLNLYGRRDDEDEPGAYFTKDHVIPRAHGGPDELSNYRTMCWPCNSRRGSGPP